MSGLRREPIQINDGAWGYEEHGGISIYIDLSKLNLRSSTVCIGTIPIRQIRAYLRHKNPPKRYPGEKK